MFVYKKLKASDANRTPFEAHKNYPITANNTSSLGINFFSARFSSESKDNYSLNDINETKKYFQLDKLYYNKDFGNNIGGLEYEDQETRLYKELNIISIPQGIFGSSIQKGTLNLFGTYVDDSKGNLYNSSIPLTDYPTDKERTFYLAPVKGFKSNDLGKNYTTGYNLVNAPSRLESITHDDSLYLNNVEYVSSSITHLPELNCTGINLETGYVRVPHNNNIDFSKDQDFTISFYYKTPSTLSGTKYLVAKSYSKTEINSPENGRTNTTGSLQPTEVDSGLSHPYEIYLTDNKVNFSRADQNTISIVTSSFTLSTDTLTHLSFVKTGSELQIYYTGSKLDSGSDNTTLTKTKANLYIGNQGGSRSRYPSSGGTISQLMVFNKALNSTQISNISSSITGLPYIGNVFYENGLITITSPKHTNTLINVNDTLNSEVIIGPTYGTINDFDIRQLATTGDTIFTSSFRAYDFSLEEDNVFSDTLYNTIDFQNTGSLGSFISSSNHTGDPVVGEYSLFQAQSPIERDESFEVVAYRTFTQHVGGVYHNPNTISILGDTISTYLHPSSSTGGFNPIDSTNIEAKTTVWAVNASESSTLVNTNIKASASQFLIDESFPTSDSSISDTEFFYDQNTANSGALYINNYAIDGLVLTGSLNNMPNYLGFIKNTVGVSGINADGDTRIGIPIDGTSGGGNGFINFRDGGYTLLNANADIQIVDVPEGSNASLSFKMTPKFTNSDSGTFKQVTYKIRSGSVVIASDSATIPFATTPLSVTPLTVTRFISASDEYDMTIDMGGDPSLEMTEATLEVTSQFPEEGKLNKVALINNSIVLDDRDNDRTKKYTVQIDEIHTSASNQATGPNFNSITEGTLKITLERVFQGTATSITSSLYGPATVSGSFFKFIDLDNIDGNGTINTHLSYLRTKIELIDTSSENTLQAFGPDEGFYIKNFRVKEISGSTTVQTSANLGSSTSFITNEPVSYMNTLGPVSEYTNSTFNITSVTSPTQIVSQFPLLTIDATGSLVEIGATGSAPATNTQISASYETTASQGGVYVMSGLQFSHNFTSAFPRIRIYSGSTLVTSSFGNVSLYNVNNATGTLIATNGGGNSNRENDLPQGNSVDLGYMSAGAPLKIELDVVESNGTTLKPTPSDESASFSGLGVYYITSSTRIEDTANAEPNWSTSYNSIQINSPHTTFPFTIGAITSSGVIVGGDNVVAATLSSPLFITASAPSTQSNTFNDTPFLVEKTYNLEANSRYMLSQSFNYNFTGGNKLAYRISRTEDEPTPSNIFDHNYTFINSFISPTENSWITASFTIDTTTGGEYKSQFILYNIVPSYADNATTGDFLKLASASLEEYKPSNSIVRTGGQLFDSSSLVKIKLKVSDNTPPFNVGNANPQTYASTSIEENPPSTDEFTVQNPSLIQLNSPILVIDGGEITGSGDNEYNYYKYTSSLNVISGFDSDMAGGVLSNLGDYTNVFNINTANSNTMSVDNEVLLLENTTASVNYITSNNIDDFNLNFKNSHLIFEHEYQCTVSEDEYNFTLNPTVRQTKNTEESELANFATGSNFKPYVTTVGLYNEAGELLVVGKLGQPIKMSDETDTTFVVRYDT